MEEKTIKNWMEAVETMAEWYEKNIHTYQGGTTGKASGQRKMYDCPLLGKKVGDDCSGFVSACLWKHGVNIPLSGSGIFTQPNKSFANIMAEGGFVKMPYSIDKLQPGDIMAKNGHVEIFAGGKQSYAWGNIHDGKGKHTGEPCWMAKLSYTIIWRKEK